MNVLNAVDRLTTHQRGTPVGQRTVKVGDINALVEDWRRLDLAMRGKHQAPIVEATDPRKVIIAFGGPIGSGKSLLSTRIRTLLELDGFKIEQQTHVRNRDPEPTADMIAVIDVPTTEIARREAAENQPDFPAPRSVWRHHSGRLYRVIEITNRSPDRQDKFPTTVHYRDVRNGEPYSRKLADWHRSMTLEQFADDPDNVVNSDREGYAIEAALQHGFEMTNDDGTTFSCTQDQIIALCGAGDSERMRNTVAVNISADTTAARKAISKAIEKLRLNKAYGLLTMSSLGLGARPTSINEWIDNQLDLGCEGFQWTRPARERAAEIARGAVLHVIADKATLLTNLANEVHADNVKAGWWSDLATGEDLHGKRNVGEMLCLVHSEISEAMEGHRKGLPDDKLPHRPMYRVELVDALIRILDLLGEDNRDHPAGLVFEEKRAFNRTRADHQVENRRKAGGKTY